MVNVLHGCWEKVLATGGCQGQQLVTGGSGGSHGGLVELWHLEGCYMLKQGYLGEDNAFPYVKCFTAFYKPNMYYTHLSVKHLHPQT